MTSRTLPDAVLWDMDGTLIHSEPIWMEAEIEQITERGGRWDPDLALDIVGYDLMTSARVILEATGVPGEPEEFMVELVDRVVTRVRSQGPVWRPGARELLNQCRAAGVPLALVTASWTTFAETVSEAAGGFDAVVPGDLVANGKPDPEGYVLAARLLGADVSRSVALEDSVPGVAAARASGARTVAIPLMVPIPAAPGLSRVTSLERVDLDLLGEIAAGRTVDHFAGEVAEPVAQPPHSAD